MKKSYKDILIQTMDEYGDIIDEVTVSEEDLGKNPYPSDPYIVEMDRQLKEKGWGWSSEEDEEPKQTKKEKQFEDFAKIAMRELVEAGQADFVLLKNDKLRAWWQKVVEAELAEQKRLDAIQRKKMLKEQALGKLSDEEKEALGLTRKR